MALKKEIAFNRGIGLLQGSIEVAEICGKDINIPGLIKTLNEVKGIFEQSLKQHNQQQ